MALFTPRLSFFVLSTKTKQNCCTFVWPPPPNLIIHSIWTCYVWNERKPICDQISNLLLFNRDYTITFPPLIVFLSRAIVARCSRVSLVKSYRFATLITAMDNETCHEMFVYFSWLDCATSDRQYCQSAVAGYQVSYSHILMYTLANTAGIGNVDIERFDNKPADY